MTEYFSILLVEDRPRTMKGHVKAIEDHIRKLGLEPRIIIDETGDTVLDHIRDDDVEIIVTDKSIRTDMDGVAIVKMINDTRSLVDILFYSASQYDPEEIRKLVGANARAEFKSRDEVEQSVKYMIDRNLARLKDIYFLRGVVISKIIDLELMVNEIIAIYFQIPNERIRSFHDFVMENRYNALQGKIETLFRLLEDEKIIRKEGRKIVYLDEKFDNLIEKLRNLQDNRNILAHCRRHENPDVNELVSMGTKETFDRKRICNILKNVKKSAKQLTDLKDKLEK
jgi:hypothetical protein